MPFFACVFTQRAFAEEGKSRRFAGFKALGNARITRGEKVFCKLMSMFFAKRETNWGVHRRIIPNSYFPFAPLGGYCSQEGMVLGITC